MAEVSQYNFNFKEFVELLIKHQGLHEGVWSLNFNLNIGTGLMGPSQDQSFPSAMVQIVSLGLARVEEGTPRPPSSVDAAAVNPPSKRSEDGKKSPSRVVLKQKRQE